MKSASQSEDRRTFSRWSAPTTKTTTTNLTSRKSTRNSPFDLGLIPVSFRFETRASRTLLNRLHRRMPQSSIYFRRTVLPIHLKIDAMQIMGTREYIVSMRLFTFFLSLSEHQHQKLQGVLLCSNLLCNCDRLPTRFLVGNLA